MTISVPPDEAPIKNDSDRVAQKQKKGSMYGRDVYVSARIDPTSSVRRIDSTNSVRTESIGLDSQKGTDQTPPERIMPPAHLRRMHEGYEVSYKTRGKNFVKGAFVDTTAITGLYQMFLIPGAALLITSAIDDTCYYDNRRVAGITLTTIACVSSVITLIFLAWVTKTGGFKKREAVLPDTNNLPRVRYRENELTSINNITSFSLAGVSSGVLTLGLQLLKKDEACDYDSDGMQTNFDCDSDGICAFHESAEDLGSLLLYGGIISLATLYIIQGLFACCTNRDYR